MSAQALPVEVAAPPVMRVEGLTMHFPAGGGVGPFGTRRWIHAVDDVSFDLTPGRVTALVGESGSGKSTVVRCLARLYEPTAGTIMFHGEDVTHLKQRKELLQYRAQVQMIFQDPFGSLNPVKTVEHHIERPLKIHHIVPRNEIHRRVLDLLSSVGLSPAQEFAAKYPHQLSGGQRQRVAIARTLAVEPTVLLADEPISMLDVSIRIGILNLMHELKASRNIAFLYITHDIASARYIADDVLVMYAGQVVEQGPTDAVLQNPLHPYTRLLLSAVPNPEAGLTGRRIQGRGEVPVVIDPPEACRFTARCPNVMDRCRTAMPRLAEVEPGHLVRCYLYPNS
ncbi:MAG TPA: ABC transporter ATP-binding protein [Chloroflexota bacterium]|nr:ABC transporter ATP-binding protein [Chloroflexota bacterium]